VLDVAEGGDAWQPVLHRAQVAVEAVLLHGVAVRAQHVCKLLREANRVT
jgi:hypothetical protein